MNVQSWISGEECIGALWISGRAKSSWVVAHRFCKKIADRENMPEKPISGTKAISSVAVKEATGSLITMIQ